MLDLRNLSGCFRKAINNDNHISSVRVSPIKRVQSRISSMMSDKCLNEDPIDSDRRPKFQKTLLSFDIAFVLSENLPTSRIFRGTHGTSDRQIESGQHPSNQRALLRVAVRREEGGQVESWVSESVGGAEHA
ncbi:hypothetical protein EAG_15085 [Camponotus floridanus]|uniref:Uncharacterized protein n=1 Tax=Camponotus floridanus TaxID=104421 RepID=E2AGY8_CAMFO|nr:hypothetical protein EAG_15085 [Camponotus floridanus]